jgi:transposase
MSFNATFVGVDANREIIEASVRPTGELLQVGSNEEGMTEISDKLYRIQPQLVVMQANGTFELPLAGFFATVGLPFALVQPRHLREFAKAIGRNTRVPQEQAGLLAHFAELVRPDAWPLSEDQIQQLKDLRERRQEIKDMIVVERERLAQASSAVQKDLQRHIYFLERSLAGIDEQFSNTIRVSRSPISARLNV